MPGYDDNRAFGEALIEHGLARREHVEECPRELQPGQKLGELLLRQGLIAAVASENKVLLEVNDAARGKRAIAVVREVLERGGLKEGDEKILQQTIEQLKARWGG